MTNRDDGQLSKRVEFKAIDTERQIATGVVFVPDKVDLHGDFARSELIEEWSTDYMRRLQSIDAPAESGVMHTAFPEDHVSLVENTILDEDRTIGGKDVVAGSWVQSWQYHDDELWSLVEDEIFSGYSIGGQEMAWSGPMAIEDVPDDVSVADRYDGEQAWEILDGMIWEVSSVDIPAVPDAEILTTKGLEKALPQGKDEFIADFVERGHSEEEAERVYRYIQRVTGGTMAAADGPGWLQRAKAFFSGDGEGARKSAAADVDTASKESRTLSAANRRRLMAAHDEIEDTLSTELDFEQNRFSDNDDYGFSLDGKSASMESAPDGDTSDDTTTNMTDGDDPFDDAPEWAKALHEEQKANSEEIKELKEADASDDDDDDDDDDKDAFDGAPAWAKALQEEQEKNADAIEEIGKQTGTSQQLGGEPGDGGSGKSEPGLDSADMAGKVFGVPTAATEE